MRGKPGILLELADKRKVIVYNDQPLLETKGVVVLNLIDDEYKLILNEQEKPKTILKTVHKYNLENQNELNKVIGYVD